MNVAYISRSTLFSDPGGDTIQIVQTAKHLASSGVNAEIILTNDPVDYNKYDLYHFFNLTRPADILYHIKRIKKPFVISPVLVDYSEYDRKYRKGFSGKLLRLFSREGGEYIKTVSRWIAGKDILKSKSYLWKGHDKSVKLILQKAAALLPNSDEEYDYLYKLYGIQKPYWNVPCGIDPLLFRANNSIEKDDRLVICVGRLEGRKNQLNLIKALNNTEFELVIIGPPALNQKKYVNECMNLASKNIRFLGQQSQEALTEYYQKAKVHVLASWFESCGLTSLEAAAMRCNIVVTEKGFTREYYGDDAFYCDPADPSSIFNAVKLAANSKPNERLKQKILENYTWDKAAEVTLQAYRKIPGS